MRVLRYGVPLAAAAVLLSATTWAQDDPPATDGDGTVAVSADLDEFREQLLSYLHDMDGVLYTALQNPALSERVETALAGSMLQVPFSSSLYASVENATYPELEQVRSAFVSAPGVLEIPGVLSTAAGSLSASGPVDRAVAAACGDNYAEYRNVVSLQDTTRALTRALDITAFFYSILNTFTEVLGAATEDTPYVGKIPSTPFVVIRGIFEVVRIALEFARDDLNYQKTNSELCIASCLTDDNDVHGQPSAQWRGRGCDNRDNNCVDGIDDDAEDRFAPEVSVDAALLGQCFSNAPSAQAAAELAVKATDDCSEPTSQVSLGAPSPTTCKAGFSVAVQDDAGNMTSLTGPHLQLTIDGEPPLLEIPTLDACYPTVDSARGALTGNGFRVTDCTAVDLSVGIVEKECLADLEITATDACGNRSGARRSVRVDAAPPEIDIAALTVPSHDGLACFASETDAVTAIREATSVADRCTAAEDLIRTTTPSGDACNLTVTSRAQDQCGLSASDSLLVRVDHEAPVVSCSVDKSVLYPPVGRLIDIGFHMTASDNCEPNGPRIDVQVTSDEPTALAYSAVVGEDLNPDAVITRAADGSLERIQVRAQRSTEGKADGRVYRIRVTATDSCGLQSFADCWVTVPRTKPGPGSAINSGQTFDATQYN